MQSCEQTGENDVHGYYAINVTFVGPDIDSKYKITYAGKDVNNNVFSKNIEKGHFVIYDEDSTQVLIDTIISGKVNSTIELIKLPGKKIEFYHANEYLKFNARLSLNEGYRMTINGQEIRNGLNYLKKTDSNGEIAYYKIGELNPVFITKANIKAGENYVVLQTGPDNFMEITSTAPESESAPTSPNLGKVCFFYSPTGEYLKDVDAIELEFVSYDIPNATTITPLPTTLVVEKNKLSPYLELDLAEYKDLLNCSAGFAYNVYKYDVSTKTRGDLLLSYDAGTTMFQMPAQENDKYKTRYKFMIFQINQNCNAVFISGTEW